LFAPSQTLNVYVNGVLQAKSAYNVTDYANGIIVLNTQTALPVTADYTTNQSIPADIQEAMILLVSHIIGQASQNPLGANSYGIQTYNINFGNDESKVEKRVEDIVQHYTNNTPKFI